MAGRGTDILLAVNPDVMAEDILRKLELSQPEATQEQRSRSQRSQRDLEREAVTAAGGLCVIGIERREPSH